MRKVNEKIRELNARGMSWTDLIIGAPLEPALPMASVDRIRTGTNGVRDERAKWRGRP